MFLTGSQINNKQKLFELFVWIDLIWTLRVNSLIYDPGDMNTAVQRVSRWAVVAFLYLVINRWEWGVNPLTAE